jgi:DNA-directed RNA polymerase specialized sigma subunit
MYLNNANLLNELINFKKSGKYSENLGGMFLQVATNLSNKANFIGYTWKDEMISEAVLTCIKYSKNFNPEKSNNAFAYITQICYNAFRNYIKKQNKHSIMKQQLYDKKDLIMGDTRYTYTSIDYTRFKNEDTKQ